MRKEKHMTQSFEFFLVVMKYNEESLKFFLGLFFIASVNYRNHVFIAHKVSRNIQAK